MKKPRKITKKLLRKANAVQIKDGGVTPGIVHYTQKLAEHKQLLVNMSRLSDTKLALFDVWHSLEKLPTNKRDAKIVECIGAAKQIGDSLTVLVTKLMQVTSINGANLDAEHDNLVRAIESYVSDLESTKGDAIDEDAVCQ